MTIATALREGLPPGIYSKTIVPHNRYHSDPCERPSLSSHVAQEIIKHSAGHAARIHPRLGGEPYRRKSEAVDNGNILHALILGGGAEIVEVDANDWRTNAAKTQREEADATGKIAVLAHKMVALKEAVSKIVTLLPFNLGDADREVTVVWESNGCPCRCRVDAFFKREWWIWDLKFCEDASLSAADRNIAAMGYPIQAAANIEAIETTFPEAAGRVHFGLCFVEWERPEIGIMRREIRGQVLSVGQSRWSRAKATWAQCLELGQWPGYSTEIVEAQCPAWIANEELETQLKQGVPF